MADVYPKNTTIEIYRNVPLDKTYRNTVHYDNATAQYNDFQQYKYKTYEKQSYQRWGIGTLKVEERCEVLMYCNYMIFKNPTMDSRVYCFIDGVSYVSETVTEVYYTIDVLQTYMFQYSFKKCFIERQHAYNDIQGTNTQPEGLEIGNVYLTNSNNSFNQVISDSGDLRYIVVATSLSNGQQPDARATMRNKIPNGLCIFVHTSVDDLNSTIKAFVNNGLEDNIINVYMAPLNGVTHEWSKTITHTTLGSYTPKNKKLLTYPYCYMQAGNNMGNYVELYYERLNGDKANKTIKYNVTYLDYPQPILVLEPEVNGIFPNRDYQLTYSVFPTTAWSGDSFKVWWAQNKNTYIATMNAIQSNYDTNMSVANNNFQQAINSATANRQATLNSISNGLTTAKMQSNVARRQASNNFDLATQNLSGAISQGVSNAVGSAFDWLWSTGGNDPSGNLTKRNNQSALNDANTILTNTLNSTNVTAQNTLNNANLSADLTDRVAQATASTNTENAELAYSTARKNATLSQASANLTALTTAQNATASLVAKKQDAMHQPATAHGQSSCDGANAFLGRLGFRFEDKYIAPEYAQQIDNYFTMYGYAVNNMDTPNINTRKYYTYLKTANCNLNTRLIDASTEQTIEGIYNNGITTWKALNQVGNYDLDNTPNGEQY